LSSRPGHRAHQHELALNTPRRSNQAMSDATAIHGHEIIELVSAYPNGIRLSQLMEVVGERFGKSATFHTCSAAGMDLDELLHFLEARDKVRITGGVVYPGGSPACEH
jgi:probable metal-binding protein